MNIIDKYKLGIVYKDNKMINHRSLFKVMFNPIFRYFGFCCGTVFIDNKLKGIRFLLCKRSKKIKYEKYNCEYDEIKKKRILI